ncbi:MAG: AraC family transcriptional regulator [Eubacteriales bacterium]
MFRDYDYKGICIGEVKMIQPIETHWHSFYEIDFFTLGKRTHNLNGIDNYLHDGDLILLSPTDFHSYPEDTGVLEGYTIRFHENDIEKQLLTPLWKSSGQIYKFAGIEKELLEKELYFMYTNYRTMNPYRDELIRNILNRIIILISRKRSDDSPLSTHSEDRINASLLYIDQHFRNDIKLEDAADSAGYSKSRFSIIFHEKLGITFRDYILKRRLQWAYELIRRGDMSVTQVCFDAGFNDLSYFGRMFKKEYGIRAVELLVKNKI